MATRTAKKGGRKKKDNTPAVRNGENLPAEWEGLMSEDAGKGNENVGVDDIAIPYLQILQSNSPQVQRGDGKFIKAADVGDILNSVTGELFKGEEEGIRVIPCHYERCLVEWVPRTKGGGFRGRYPIGDPIMDTAKRDDETGKDMLPNGNELKNTAYHYVLLARPDGGIDRAVIGMDSTQLKKSRKWNTMTSSKVAQGKNGTFNPPSFAYIYTLTTTPESNAKGNWMGWVISEGERVTDKDVYLTARAFSQAISSGAIKAADPQDAEADADQAADIL